MIVPPILFKRIELFETALLEIIIKQGIDINYRVVYNLIVLKHLNKRRAKPLK